VSESLVWFVAYVATLGAVAWWGLRRTKRAEVAEWAARYDLSPSEVTEGLLERYLSWTRRWRMAGALLGVGPFVKWILFDHADDPDPGPIPWLILVGVGYLLGALAAEITLNGIHQIEIPAVPSAALEERRPEMYVGKSAMRILWAVVAASVGLVPAYLLVADGPHIHSRFGIVVGAAVSVLILALAVRWLVRYVVLRPQPAVSDESRRADNAMRSYSLHGIVGGAVAIGLIFLSTSITELQDALEAQAPHSGVEFISVVTAGLLVFALAGWIILSRPRPGDGLHNSSGVRS
jgi:hypothetical protein